jgi:hypothetical protein
VRSFVSALHTPLTDLFALMRGSSMTDIPYSGEPAFTRWPGCRSCRTPLASPVLGAEPC